MHHCEHLRTCKDQLSVTELQGISWTAELLPINCCTQNIVSYELLKLPHEHEFMSTGKN